MVNSKKGHGLTLRIRLLSELSTRAAVEVDDWLARLLPGRCFLCLASLGDERRGSRPVRWQRAAPLCITCRRHLPFNRRGCPGCGEPLSVAAPSLCGRCLVRPASFDATLAPLLYRGEVRQLMQRYKFGADRRCGQLLVAVFLEGLLERSSEEPGDARQVSPMPEALVAVPVHPERARQRGFDQAQWLTRQLARRLGIPCCVARRRRDDGSQRGLDRRQRRHNLRHAFVVDGRLPQHIALVDDVMTTGATLDSLARACRRHGACHVEAWALARTPRSELC